MSFNESWCQLSKTRPVYYICLFCCVFFFFSYMIRLIMIKVYKVLKSSVRFIFSFMIRKTDLCLSLVFLQELSLFPYSQHILFTGQRNSLVNDSRQCSAIQHQTGKQIYGNIFSNWLTVTTETKTTFSIYVDFITFPSFSVVHCLIFSPTCFKLSLKLNSITEKKAKHRKVGFSVFDFPARFLKCGKRVGVIVLVCYMTLLLKPALLNHFSLNCFNLISRILPLSCDV